MKTVHKVIIGDSRNMKEVPDESVHLIVTSPPYWNLKDYGSEEQIGFNESYDEYIKDLNYVWKESYRVLHKGCKLCVNIVDTYTSIKDFGRHKLISIQSDIIKSCEKIGFDYMGEIIWKKLSNGGATVMGSYPYPRNGLIKFEHEFILIFKKLGEAPKVSEEIKKQSRLTKEEWLEYFNGQWAFSGVRQKEHPAMFPEELPKRLIKMFSFVGETVLDPFLGSGTTMLAAKNLNRNSIGYEINEEFLPVISKKVELTSNSIFQDATFEVIKQG